MTGAAVRIAVGPNGVPWVVNNGGLVFHGTANGQGWTQINGNILGSDISVGYDGTVWIIGAVTGATAYTGITGNGNVYRY